MKNLFLMAGLALSAITSVQVSAWEPPRARAREALATPAVVVAPAVHVAPVVVAPAVGVVVAPAELPTGILTALMGAPFFVALLLQQRRSL